MPRSLPTDEQEYYSRSGAQESERLRKIESIRDIRAATRSEGAIILAELMESAPPYPSRKWLLGKFDSPSDWDIFQVLKDVTGQPFLQLGGSGLTAVMYAILGAKSHLVSPLVEECAVGQELARLFGVELQCEVGFAEEIPYPAESFAIVYSGGCAHHFDTALAFPEIARVLKQDGIFAAVEPWRSPLHSIGTKAFGKRETEVHCRPLNDERMEPFFRYFSGKVTHHSLITRYAMLALGKLGLSIPFGAAFAIMRFEDRLTPPFLAKFGSGVSVIGTKRA